LVAIVLDTGFTFLARFLEPQNTQRRFSPPRFVDVEEDGLQAVLPDA
jgi:hypothetical protein